MTTLVSWLGVDQRGHSSIYFAADSRFTWSPGVTWDHGRKLFASRVRPVILAYCGDVVFASNTTAQALELIEANLLFSEDAAPQIQVERLEAFIKDSFVGIPSRLRSPFSVLYASRIGLGFGATFFLAEVSYSLPSDWSVDVPTLPAQSELLLARGSGADKFMVFHRKWAASEIHGTSRLVYSAFCDHLSSAHDPATGGPPQLVGLDLKESAITFGTIYRNARWVSGAPVNDQGDVTSVFWRDELFQRCDGQSLKPIVGAQKHARPRSA